MNKTINILVGVLVAQIVIFGLMSIDTNRVTEKKKFLSTDTSQVNYVKIKYKDDITVLKKIGQNWRITEPYNNFPANPSYMKTLLEKVAGLELESYITSNKDSYAQYELSDTAASYVEIGREGSSIDKFWCGKPSDNYTHSYVRREGSNEVWLVSGTPRASFQRRAKDWRDKNVLTLDRTQIERIVLRFPNEMYDLTRVLPGRTDTTSMDTTWKVTPPKGASFKPETNVMNRILNTVSRLNSMDILDPTEDAVPTFEKIDFTAEVFLEGNIQRKLEFSPDPSDDTRWICRLDGNQQNLYAIYQSSVKNLMKREDELKGGEKYENPQEKKPSSVRPG